MADAEEPEWLALRAGIVAVNGKPHTLAVVDAGELALPSGRLVAEDPWVGLGPENSYYAVPPGRYPVRVTVDQTWGREMYLSLLLDPAAQEVSHAPLVPYLHSGVRRPELEPGEGYGAAVDAGTVCFVDDAAYVRMTQGERTTWLPVLASDTPGSWSYAMAAEGPLPAGIANVSLPGATDGANIILCHSGWGDGFYPVIGGYDAAGRLVAVHLDLLLYVGLADTAEEP